MGGFAARAVRWRFLLAPAQPRSPYRSRFAAVCVGFMANNLLPSGRVGELGRAYAYSRLEPVSMPAAFATLIVERLIDGVAIFALLVLAVASASFPAGTLPDVLVAGIRGVTGVLAAVLLFTVTLVAFPKRAGRTVGGAGRASAPTAPGDRFSTRSSRRSWPDWPSMRGWRHMLPALLLSFVVWLIQSLSFWIGFEAFGIDLPFAAALFVNAAIAVAVAMPAAPGYLGTFPARRVRRTGRGVRRGRRGRRGLRIGMAFRELLPHHPGGSVVRPGASASPSAISGLAAPDEHPGQRRKGAPGAVSPSRARPRSTSSCAFWPGRTPGIIRSRPCCRPSDSTTAWKRIRPTAESG